MASEVRPGLYLVQTREGKRELQSWNGVSWPNLIRRDLPFGWSIIAHIDDLLRDAERFRWVSGVSTGGLRALDWDWKGTGERGRLIDAELAREKQERDE